MGLGAVARGYRKSQKSTGKRAPFGVESRPVPFSSAAVATVAASSLWPGGGWCSVALARRRGEESLHAAPRGIAMSYSGKICYFYLQGNCRYGEMCWNQHPRHLQGSSQPPQSSGSSRRVGWGGHNQRSIVVQASNFPKSTNWHSSRDHGKTYHGPQADSGFTQNRFAALNANENSGGIKSEEEMLLEIIMKDMEIWESSGQWMFSSYSPSKDNYNISGFLAFSPEELRLEYYNCRANNNIQNYINTVQQLVTQWRSRLLELKNINPSTKTALLAELKNVANQPQPAFGFGGQPSSAFGTSKFRDVMTRGRASSHDISHKKLSGWSSDHNHWNEKLYPCWEDGDARWDNCWKGGKVMTSLTSDSPALVGSNVTFSVQLKFPRCQKEDTDGNIIYDRSCRNGSLDYSDLSNQYVYNWTQWIDHCGWQNCTHNNSHHVFPDGRPFPHHRDWRRRNFVYIFHTLGQYYQKTGGSSAMVSINTTNITLGSHIMEVSVYRRDYRSYMPVTTASIVYVVTDTILLYVNMSQMNDRNASDHIFIKDIPITLQVYLHDPSHYLNRSDISYHWDFGDGSGAFVFNNPVSMHTYTLVGNFSLNLTVEAIIPAPCGSVTPPPPFPTFPVPPNETTPRLDSLTELPTGEALAGGCNITRYGHYQSSLSITEGILGVNIIQMTSIQLAGAEAENSVVDFVVTCQGSLPTDACTIIADPTCQVLQNEVCDPVNITDQCLLTIRRAFNESGTYCVNITLGDAASLALARTLVSIGGVAGPFSRTAEGVLISCSLLVVFAAVLTFFLYKRYKEYRPIDRNTGQEANRLNVYFNNVKAFLFQSNNEKDPLLKNKPGVI